METILQHIGIDVSKDTLDVAFPQTGGVYEVIQLSNDASGYSSLLSKLNPLHRCVVEATGSFHIALCVFLHQNDHGVSVVNPLSVKHFARMMMRRAKTDRIDAQVIAQYGQMTQPKLWEPQTAHLTQLHQLLSVAEQLTKQKTALTNHRKDLVRVPNYSEKALQVLDSQIESLESQLRELDEAVRQIVQTHYAGLDENLRSIPGIGPKTAAALIVLTEGFTKFASYKALIAYAGLAPRTFQSGSSVKGVSHICKLGAAFLRKLLYECAHSAKRFNPCCRSLFKRLFEEKKKPYRVAMIAVANKLIKLAFAIASSGKPFDPRFNSQTQPTQ